MKVFYNQNFQTPETIEEDFSIPTLRQDLEKTRTALEIAYAGFDNAVDADMIDCYIYEINALLKRYKHLTELSAAEENLFSEKKSYQQSPIRALVSHVFG